MAFEFVVEQECSLLRVVVRCFRQLFCFRLVVQIELPNVTPFRGSISWQSKMLFANSTNTAFPFRGSFSSKVLYTRYSKRRYCDVY